MLFSFRVHEAMADTKPAVTSAKIASGTCLCHRWTREAPRDPGDVVRVVTEGKETRPTQSVKICAILNICSKLG
jgi:hypothetical protein